MNNKQIILVEDDLTTGTSPSGTRVQGRRPVRSDGSRLTG